MSPPGRGGSRKSWGQDRERQRRADGDRRRKKIDDASFDPAAPDDEDWTVEQGASLRKVRGPQSVSAIAESLIGRKAWSQRVASSKLLDRWEEVVGPQVAANSRPLSLDRGVLVVVARDQAWATQLGWLERQIIDECNALAGRQDVKKVRLQVGQLDEGRPEDA